MQPRGLHLPHGRRLSDGLEMTMKRGHAHTGLTAQLHKIERLRVCGQGEQAARWQCNR
jgi:hypothetical protein